MVNVVLVFDSRGESCLALGHRGVVVVTLDAAHVLAARKTAMQPQKNAEGHRSLIGDAVGRGTDRSVIFCAFCGCILDGSARTASGLAPSRPLERIRAWVLGGKYLIAVSARTVCARRNTSRPRSCRRCQEPPSTTCRFLDRLTLGGSRHRRRNDSRARRASLVFAA